MRARVLATDGAAQDAVLASGRPEHNLEETASSWTASPDVHKRDIKKMFHASLACMYPAYNRDEQLNPSCSEASAYPAAPDSEYGWEKLFSERLYLAYRRNF